MSRRKDDKAEVRVLAYERATQQVGCKNVRTSNHMTRRSNPMRRARPKPLLQTNEAGSEKIGLSNQQIVGYDPKQNDASPS